MPADPVDLGPLVDHHCHGLIIDDLDRPSFEALMNEAVAPSPLGTTFFDSMLGLAVRRWCAPVLGLEAHASSEDYLERRQGLGAEASRSLVAAAGIKTFLVDVGIGADRLCSAAELAAMSGGTAYEVVRLEALAEELLNKETLVASFAEAIEEALHDSSAVAAKSIAAYRIGLDLPPDPPSDDDIAAAFTNLRPAADGHYRLAHPVINSWLAWTAIKIGMPLQIHVGYGDADIDLLRADPLRLTPFLRATEKLGVPVLLLHNYPFHRHAAYLAQVFSHVFMDIGLAVHNTGALSQALIRETLELVPFGKLLFSSDAYGLAEFYYLGAELFRRGLSTVLDELIKGDEMTSQDADQVAALIARDNARRAYRLWNHQQVPPRRTTRTRRSTMTISDIGPEPQSFNLEKETVQNSNYRTVAWSGKYLQLTFMSIPEGGDIGLEAHPETDQFLRLDAGRGRVQMGPARDKLDFDQEVSDGWCVLVPAGTWHNITNIGDEPMQVYAVYAPAHHKPGKVHATAADAAADTDDEPASWSVQPVSATDLDA